MTRLLFKNLLLVLMISKMLSASTFLGFESGFIKETLDTSGTMGKRGFQLGLNLNKDTYIGTIPIDFGVGLHYLEAKSDSSWVQTMWANADMSYRFKMGQFEVGPMASINVGPSGFSDSTPYDVTVRPSVGIHAVANLRSEYGIPMRFSLKVLQDIRNGSRHLNQTLVGLQIPIDMPVQNAKYGFVILDSNAVLFGVNQYKIGSSSSDHLDQLVRILKKNNTEWKQILIEGHADKTGPVEWNYRLSKWRANSTVKYLVSKGISRDRISTKSYGETLPLVSSWTSSGQRVNRRAQIVIEGDLNDSNFVSEFNQLNRVVQSGSDSPLLTSGL